jgi:hypothetical protein
MAKHRRVIGGESGVIRWFHVDAAWIANARAYLRDGECYCKAVLAHYEASEARWGAMVVRGEQAT